MHDAKCRFAMEGEREPQPLGPWLSDEARDHGDNARIAGETAGRRRGQCQRYKHRRARSGRARGQVADDPYGRRSVGRSTRERHPPRFPVRRIEEASACSPGRREASILMSAHCERANGVFTRSLDRMFKAVQNESVCMQGPIIFLGVNKNFSGLHGRIVD
eukprot:2595633-Pleurochrysis_carterae.AAC.1